MIFDRHKQLPANLILTVVYLSSPCLLISLIFLKLGVNLTQARLLVLGGLGFWALVSLKMATFTHLQKKILAVYIVILMYLGGLWNFGIFESGSERAVFRAILIGPLLMIAMNSKTFSIKKFVGVYIWVAVILGGLSIFQYFLVLIGIAPLAPPPPEARFEGFLVGFGGFFDPTAEYVAFLSGLRYRNIGFFSEPTNFAQFLMIPLFLIAQKWLQTKNRADRMKLIIVSIAFFLTFSAANFFGFLFGALSYFWIKSIRREPGNKNIRRRIIFVIAMFLIAYIGHSFYEITEKYSRNEFIIGKSTTKSIMARIDRNVNYFERLKDYPFGDINYKHEYRVNTGFWGHVGITGGLPLIGIVGYLLFIFFRTMMKMIRKTKYPLVYCGFIAYFVAALWDAKFYENYFLFLIALYSVFIKIDSIRYYSKI